MKIVLATFGSRGDVQPMLALSLALQSAGHEVLLAAPPCPALPACRDRHGPEGPGDRNQVLIRMG